MTERRAISGLAVRWSHVIILLVTWIFGLGVLYAGLKDDHAHIERLESNSVDRREYDDLKQRMTRIEEKLDRALRH